MGRWPSRGSLEIDNPEPAVTTVPQLSTAQALGLKMPPTLLVHAAGWASGGHPREDQTSQNAGRSCNRTKILCSSQNNSLIA